MSDGSLTGMNGFEGKTMMGTEVRFDWDAKRCWIDGEEKDFETNLELAKDAMKEGEFVEAEGDMRPLLE